MVMTSGGRKSSHRSNIGDTKYSVTYFNIVTLHEGMKVIHKANVKEKSKELL